MSLFTGAALIGAALATTGGAVAAAKMGSSATKDAANLQADAAQQALDFTKQQKAAQEAHAAPYLALGGQAVANLPGAVRPTPTGGPPMPYGVAPGSMPQGQQTGYSNASMMAPRPAYGNSSGSSLANMGGPPMASAGVVTLQAPDGSTRQVPAAQATQLMQQYPVLKKVG